jgi:hypothetical protein
MERWLGLAALVIVALRMPAQGAALEAVRDAERALAEKRDEDAARLARSAARLARELPAGAVREEIERAASAVVTKADAGAKARDDAISAAVARIVAIADRYAEAGWHRTALAWLDRVESPGDERVAARIERSRTALGAAAPPAAGAAAHLAAGESIDGPDGWALDDASLQSPSVATGTASFRTGIRLADTVRIASAVDFGEGEVGVGIVFAFRSVEDYHVVFLYRRPQGLGVEIARFGGTEFEKLHSEWYGMPAKPKDAPGDVHVVVDAKPGHVALEVRGLPRIAVAAPQLVGGGFAGFDVFALGAAAVAARFHGIEIIGSVR